MKCLDRYIAREFGKTFLLFFIVLNAFLCFVDSYAHLEKFLKYHTPFGEIFRYYIAHAVAYLPLTLPITFAAALVFLATAMHRHNEMLPLSSSGLGFFKITRIFWLFGLAGSLLLLLCNFHWIPRAQEYEQRYLEGFEKNDTGAEMSCAKHLTLSTPQRLWYINRYDKNLAYAFGISVCEYAGGTEFRRITAKLGYFDENVKAWVMEQGREILFHPELQIADRVNVFDRRVFAELNDPPKWMLLLQLPPNYLSLFQLKEIIGYESRLFPGGHAIYRMYFYDIILSSLVCFLSCWVALPLFFALARTNLWHSIAKLCGIFLVYGVISHILHALAQKAAFPWFYYVLLIPFAFLLLVPLPWLRKLL
ncbi:MAG: LptF/LptG family permease [Puniceicoccales bacterium]|jgi:lipopolysaccharide export system permease protein|nr:LptF/LptG family permease [Puniceicoccales bacterium]